MPDSKQLPYLIKLLDDDSPVVQEVVTKELLSFGPALETELTQLNILLNPNQKRIINNLLESHVRKWLKEVWPGCLKIKDDNQKLESALSLISEFQYRKNYPVKLEILLDRLAGEYNSNYKYSDPLLLSNFLFKVKGFKGSSSDYYNPMNSNLVYVIQEKYGIPISLSCIYILIGYRLGLEVEGLNFPGHFLTRVNLGTQKVIVDCFNRGDIFNERDLNIVGISNIKNVDWLKCEAITIIKRVLRNLINAYKLQQNKDNLQLMVDLLEMLE